ncbi:hypothetical protein HYT84_03165 [Candidatus Micrarchaeota archaeon]|nr:hypothetical protein [Candidatus Micrarchaeota archaeon]
MGFQSFYESFGRFFSREQVKSLGRYLRSAGIETSPEAFAGYFLLNMAVLTLLVILVVLYDNSLYSAVNGFLLYLFPFLYKEVIALFVILAAVLFVYFTLFVLISSFLVIKAEARKKAVEAVLPDFLLLVSANIKAGMALDQAIWYSAKPEFGLLSKEVKIVIKKAFSGEPLHSALDELAERKIKELLDKAEGVVEWSKRKLTG